MGDPVLMSFLAMKRERRRRLRCHRQIRRDRGSVASVATRKGPQCQHDDNSQACKGSELYLPEDILRHIHALMPLRDAARASCISHAFLRSWRCHPYLTLTEETLGFNKNAVTQDDITREFINKIKPILQNHDGIGVKALELDLFRCSNIDSCYLDRWLHIAVAPGIEELNLMFPIVSKAEYNFPCSLLFDRGGNSIRYLHLSDCSFHPTVGLGCMRSLTQLHLSTVRITGDELELLLCKSFTLECLKLSYCDEIIHMKIPCLLKRLSNLQVADCKSLQSIESYAPNLSTFHLHGLLVRLSFGNPLLVKNVKIVCLYQANIVSYARTELMSIVPNVETLDIYSSSEIVNTPMVPGKFLHLRYLHAYFVGVAFSPNYDYFSLVSFLDASPSLETFILSVMQHRMEHDSVFGETAHLRRMPEHRHEKLKSVKISGFCSAKSMVELTCHILENAPSLECLTLDTTNGAARCSSSKSGKCYSMENDILMEAHKALLAIRTCVQGKVPPAVKLNVVEPCSRCHVLEI